MASYNGKQQPLPPAKSGKGSSFDAFSKVDELVSKPVLGSEGAASWQAFRKDTTNVNDRLRVSVAPKAPLKKQDRLGTGFSSWEEERAHEARVRDRAGHAGANSGYTSFKKDRSAAEEEAISRKRKARVEARKRPDDEVYFIPSKVFDGWKFDYVFTTKNNVTGYYWDGMDSVKKERGESLPEEKKNRISSSSSSPSTKHFEGNDAPHPKKTKKKSKKKKGPVIRHDPNNPMEQMQAILERRNQTLMGITTTQTNHDLPSGWEAAKDPSTGNSYYFHRATGDRTWEKPKTSADGACSSTKDHDNEATSEALPAGWKSDVDQATGKLYYHHTSGETTWTKPR